MARRLNTGVSLLELLIAIVLFAAISLGFFAIDTFSRRQVLYSERQAKVQNEVSIALEHITREVTRAIGSTAITGQSPVDLTAISGDTTLRVYVDLAADGVSAGDGKWGTAGADRWRAYRFTGASGAPADRYQLWYYSNYPTSSAYEVIARNINAFSRSTTSNYVTVDITACWDPTGAIGPCGGMRNPSVRMTANIYMPSVSLN